MRFEVLRRHGYRDFTVFRFGSWHLQTRGLGIRDFIQHPGPGSYVNVWGDKVWWFGALELWHYNDRPSDEERIHDFLAA